MSRQKTILYVLIGVLLLAVIYAYVQYPRQGRVSDSLPAAKSQVIRSARPQGGAGEDIQFRIRFDWLKNEKPFKGAKEDLFGPLHDAKKELSLAPVQTTPSLPPVSAGAGQSLLSPPALDFLGYLASGKTRTFFFAQGEDIFVAKKGVKFGKQKEFRVVGATSKELTIEKQGDTNLLTISLVAKNSVSGFNKLGVGNIQKRVEAKGTTSSVDVSAPQAEVPPDSDQKDGEEQQSPRVEFHPEGDWEK